MASSLETPSPGPQDSPAPLTSSETKLDLSSKSKDIMTYEPYLPAHSKGHRKGKFIKRSLSNEQICELSDYDKYLTLEMDSENLEIFAVHKDIVKLFGRKPKISPQNKNKIIVCTESRDESENLKSLSVIGGASVSCKSHYNMNHSKGIIYAPQLMSYTVQKLQEELKTERVVKVERMQRKIDGVITDQPNLILTFASTRLPDSISAAWYNFKVKQYIPRPRRCFYCQEFGHVLTSCRLKEQGKEALCVNCGKNAHGICQDIPKCIHCGNSHPSSSKSCDIYIMEQEIQAVKVVERLSYAEARSKVMNKYIRPGVSFSSVVAARRHNKMTRHNISVKPARPDQNLKQNEYRNRKRSISNESMSVAPPAKIPSFDHNSSSSSLPDLNVKDDYNRKTRSLSELNASSEKLMDEFLGHDTDSASAEATPLTADTLHSLKCGPDSSGSPGPGLSGPLGPDHSGPTRPALSGPTRPALFGPTLPASSGSPQPALPGSSASLEVETLAASDPGGLIPGIAAAEMHPIPPSDGERLEKATEVGTKKKDLKGKSSNTTSAKQNCKPQPSLQREAVKQNSKPQRPLQRNPRSGGQRNK